MLQAEADRQAARIEIERAATVRDAFERVSAVIRELAAEAAPLVGIPIVHICHPNGSFSLTIGNVAGTCSLSQAEGRVDLRLSSITRAPQLLIEALAHYDAGGFEAENRDVQSESKDADEPLPEAHPLRDEWMRVRTVDSAPSPAWLADGRNISGDDLVKAIIDRIAAYYMKRNFAFGGKPEWTRSDAHALRQDDRRFDTNMAAAGGA